MYTEDEVRELLEQAYSEGFDSGVEDTLDYMDENYDMEEFFEEESAFDLENEYAVYSEVTSQEDKKKAREIAAGIKQDEGEPDDEFKKRKSNIIRSSVAKMATGRNAALAGEMNKLLNNGSLQTYRAKLAAKQRSQQSVTASGRMKKAADKYGSKVRDDEERRKVKNTIRNFKNS